MTTPDLPKSPLPAITVVPDGPNLIVVGTDQIAEAARHLDGIEGWDSSHPGVYDGVPCVTFLGAKPSTASPAPADGHVSKTTGHRWPCTRFYAAASESDRCSCGKGATPAETTGAVERAAMALLPPARLPRTALHATDAASLARTTLVAATEGPEFAQVLMRWDDRLIDRFDTGEPGRADLLLAMKDALSSNRRHRVRDLRAALLGTGAGE